MLLGPHLCKVIFNHRPGPLLIAAARGPNAFQAPQSLASLSVLCCTGTVRDVQGRGPRPLPASKQAVLLCDLYNCAAQHILCTHSHICFQFGEESNLILMLSPCAAANGVAWPCLSASRGQLQNECSISELMRINNHVQTVMHMYGMLLWSPNPCTTCR